MCSTKLPPPFLFSWLVGSSVKASDWDVRFLDRPLLLLLLWLSISSCRKGFFTIFLHFLRSGKYSSLSVCVYIVVSTCWLAFFFYTTVIFYFFFSPCHIDPSIFPTRCVRNTHTSSSSPSLRCTCCILRVFFSFARIALINHLWPLLYSSLFAITWLVRIYFSISSLWWWTDPSFRYSRTVTTSMRIAHDRNQSLKQAPMLPNAAPYIY